MKKIIFLFLFLSQYALAQKECGTRQPQVLYSEAEKNELISKFRIEQNEDYELIYIPVVVHVLHIGENIGEGSNISTEQIYSQFDVLNEDFNRLNEDKTNTPENFKSVAASANIRFVPARIAPDGTRLTEAGINRIRAEKYEYSMDELEKNIIVKTIWNPNHYLNMIVVGSITSYIGFNSHFPDKSNLLGLKDVHGTAHIDAVTIRHNRFGSYKKYPAKQLEGQRNNLGRTATHEVGHYLGLIHIWGNIGGCNDDDFCEDTPNVSTSTSSCDARQACNGSPAMIQNFLDYSDDFCMNIFTIDQVKRMRQVLQNSPQRKELIDSHVRSIENQDITENIIVYPNPARDILKIQSLGFLKLSHYSLYNHFGQEVGSGKVENNQISVEHLSQGIYFLKLQSPNKEVFVKKISIL